MNYKVLAIIILLFLCFFFGFKKISSYRNVTTNGTIGELRILKYLPKDNKLLFISNFQSSNIKNNFTKNFNSKNRDEINLIKNNILSYLGIDLGKNKLEEIYNNELTISTYNNNNKNKDDILFETNKVSVIVDPTSLELIKGSKIDYVKELIGSSFKIINPQASSSCGCGTSFSI